MLTAIVWTMFAGGLGITQAALPEAPMLLVCSFGEPRQPGSARKHRLQVLYRPHGDGRYSLEVRDEAALLGGKELKFVSSRGGRDRTDLTITTSDKELTGILLTVHSQNPPEESGGLEMLSAAIGDVSQGMPRPGTCAAINGEHAVRLFEKKEPAQ